MSTHNRRSADRIPACFCAKLMTYVSSVDAAVCDLSRTGARLRLESETLGFEITSDLAAVQRDLQRILPDPVFLTLDDERLGPLIRRDAQMQRLGVPADRIAAVDVCFEFAEPLSDEEAQVLGLPLPPVKETVATWHEVADEQADEPAGAAPDGRNADAAVSAPAPPRHRYRVLVSSTLTRAPPSLFCHTDLVTAVGVRIRVPREQLGTSRSAIAYRARDAYARLVKRFGKSVEVRIHDGDRQVWSGTMRITGAEVPANDRTQILLSLAFAQRPKLSEMRRLGLAA